MTVVDYDALVAFVQSHFTDGLTLVIGSGLSAAEGMPGMPELGKHLCASISGLAGDDLARWQPIKAALDRNEGLEAVLLKNAPSASLEAVIRKHACDLLLPSERAIISETLRGHRQLRLTSLLARVLKPPTGLPIVTPNYDRLVEVACEMAGFVTPPILWTVDCDVNHAAVA